MIVIYQNKPYKIISYDRPKPGDFILATDNDNSTPAIWQTFTDWPIDSGAFILQRINSIL